MTSPSCSEGCSAPAEGGLKGLGGNNAVWGVSSSMTPFWARRLDRPRLSARQISRRGGELFVEDRGARVSIAGRCAPYLEGRITV